MQHDATLAYEPLFHANSCIIFIIFRVGSAATDAHRPVCSGKSLQARREAAQQVAGARSGHYSCKSATETNQHYARWYVRPAVLLNTCRFDQIVGLHFSNLQ